MVAVAPLKEVDGVRVVVVNVAMQETARSAAPHVPVLIERPAARRTRRYGVPERRKSPASKPTITAGLRAPVTGQPTTRCDRRRIKWQRPRSRQPRWLSGDAHRLRGRAQRSRPAADHRRALLISGTDGASTLAAMRVPYAAHVCWCRAVAYG